MVLNRLIHFYSEFKNNLYELMGSIGVMLAVFLLLILMAPFTYPVHENLYLF